LGPSFVQVSVDGTQPTHRTYDKAQSSTALRGVRTFKKHTIAQRVQLGKSLVVGNFLGLPLQNGDDSEW